MLNKSYIPTRENNPQSVQQERRQQAKVDVNKLQASRMAAAAAAGQAEKSKPAPIKVEKKVGRNDPCPCGSGKKYKHCHGKNLQYIIWYEMLVYKNLCHCVHTAMHI